MSNATIAPEKRSGHMIARLAERLMSAIITPNEKHGGERMRIRSALAYAFSGLCLATGPASAQSFYSGKQVKLLVGAAAGGGYDLLGRIMARHIGKHIPDNPSVIVQNSPAAGGLAAANALANTVERDGATIGLIQRSILLAKILSPEGARFDLGAFNWIGNLNSEASVAVVWHTSSARTARDFLTTPVIVGGMIGADPEITAKMYNALLGAQLKIINGYNGTTAIGQAMEGGEVQGTADWSWSTLKVQKRDWLRDGKVRVLLQAAVKKEEDLAQVPNVMDLVTDPLSRETMETYLIQKTLARPVVAPPDAPQDRIMILRDAFAALSADADFLAEAARAQIEISILRGEEVQRMVAKIGDLRPEVRQKLEAAAFGQR